MFSRESTHIYAFTAIPHSSQSWNTTREHRDTETGKQRWKKRRSKWRFRRGKRRDEVLLWPGWERGVKFPRTVRAGAQVRGAVVNLPPPPFPSLDPLLPPLWTRATSCRQGRGDRFRLCLLGAPCDAAELSLRRVRIARDSAEKGGGANPGGGAATASEQTAFFPPPH